MASAPTNLYELTVTCRQCGSASMERIGPREYRCTHCGAITVVSQDGTKSAPTGAPVEVPEDLPGGPPSGTTPDLNDPTRNVLTPAQVEAANKVGRHLPLFVFGACLLAAAGFVGVMHSCGGDEPPAGSTMRQTGPTPRPAISAAGLVVTPTEWTTDGKGQGGRYTGLITNRTGSAVEVPSYRMTLYLRGAQVDSAASTVPVATLLPGEYEPISFAFRTPSDDPHPEITVPALAELPLAQPLRVKLDDRQLVQENGKLGYRLVGVVNNPGSVPAKNISVVVMLFDGSHTLLGFGSYKVDRALRSGEKTAIEVDVPSSNVKPLASYEYLVDASEDVR